MQFTRSNRSNSGYGRRGGKALRLPGVILLLSLVPSGFHMQAALSPFSGESGSMSLAIPNGDVNGVQSTISVGGTPNYYIANMSVTFTVSGGYNGDLYAVLSHGSVGAVLLNRIGVGTSGSGGTMSGYNNPAGGAYTFTLGSLVDSSANNVHFYANNGGTLATTWAPDGRTIDPHSARSSFNANPGVNALTSFNNADPTGAWTLSFFDVVGGDSHPSTLTGWSLNISAGTSPVPEPINVALGVFGGVFAAVAAARRFRSRAQERAAGTSGGAGN